MSLNCNKIYRILSYPVKVVLALWLIVISPLTAFIIAKDCAEWKKAICEIFEVVKEDML